ncbi:hypothetical protein FXW26_01905 [Candidatus Liberibacter asiaticus]|nr:hypothetical protein FXW26_01905 [Candidatus Liberibacter asiaticus]
MILSIDFFMFFYKNCYFLQAVCAIYNIVWNIIFFSRYFFFRARWILWSILCKVSRTRFLFQIRKDS